MNAVKISPKYQIVIPREARQALNLKPGQKIQMIIYGQRIEMIPEKRIKSMRGFIKGLTTAPHRE